ncbi:MAG: zinc ribbon domain-containing protein [Chloroflexi bacterium]|nr:zinc ribbon domain-containing protein [Chloroflexota bacterium]
MPIYQYDCAGCRDRVEVLHRSAASMDNASCPQCGSAELTRVMSMFARARTGAQRLEEVDVEAQQAALQDGDERSFARWARRAGAEYDEALGTNYRELAEQTEAGEDPVDRFGAGHSFEHNLQHGRMRAERERQSKEGA